MTHGNGTIDPVCGMQVDPKTTELRSEYQGTLHYFCGAGCKKAFDTNPERYLHPEPGRQQHNHGH